MLPSVNANIYRCQWFRRGPTVSANSAGPVQARRHRLRTLAGDGRRRRLHLAAPARPPPRRALRARPLAARALAPLRPRALGARARTAPTRCEQLIDAHEGRLRLADPGPGRPDGRLAVRVPARLGEHHGRRLRRPAAATGITPVICGDAHLGNFGFYASPERELVFDLNDFDEAHPGAWEWDLRRLVTSVLGGRPAERLPRARLRATPYGTASQEYREQIGHLAEQPLLARSFDALDVDDLRKAATKASFREEIERAARRARRRTSDRALPRFTEQRDGTARLVEEPPLITRPSDAERDQLAAALDGYLQHAAAALGAHPGRLPDRRHRAQGGRGRLGGAAGVRGAVRGQQPRRRAVPAAQAGPPVGDRAAPARRRGLAPAPGPAGGGVSAGAADGQRPAAGLDHGRRAAVLRAPVPRHEGRDRGRGHQRRARSPTTPGSAATCWPRATPGPAARR